MTRIAPCLALLAAALLATPSLAAQDQLVLQALKRIESAETGLQSLPAGDVAAANKLLADLKWAQKRLNAAYKKDTSHWQDASKRLAAADAAIRAKAAAQPGPAPLPTGESPKPGATPTPTPAAGNGAGPVLGEQFEKLQQLDKEVGNGLRNLQLLNKSFMGDAYRVGSTTKEIAGLKQRLAGFPGGDQNVQIVAKKLASFEELFTTWKAEYAADQAAAEDLGKQVEALTQKYGSAAVPGPIHWPYEREQLTAWATLSRKLLDELPQDLATLETATQNSVIGRETRNTLAWVRRIQPRLEEQVTQAQYACNNAVADSLRTARSLREIEPDDEHAIINRVLLEGALERSMESLQQGLEAVDLAATLDAALRVADAPDRKAQRAEIEATVETLRSLAKTAVAAVRMPKAVAVDAETMTKLTAIATETLAKKKYGVHPIERLVVTSNLQRKEKKEGTLRGTVTGATITTYHYVWDEYRVVTAEKVGDEIWTFQNVLKFYHSSDTVTPQDVWILSRRFQSTQILAENVDK